MSDDTKATEVEINACGAYVKVKVSGADDCDRDWAVKQALDLWREGRIGDGRTYPAVGFTSQVPAQPARNWRTPVRDPVRGEVDL